jgi:uncharacterized protein
MYESLVALGPPALDLLLPHGNWSTPPPHWDDSGTVYGDWLCAVFDRWWQAGRRETRVRLFEECLALLLGLPAATESLGLTPFDAVVVETDGSIEQVDSLKSAYDGAARTGLDIHRHTFDDALRHPAVAARQAGAASLAATCRACPLLNVCGGGQYAHRYRAGHGFRNPSVYCADLQRFIRHVSSRLAAAASAGASSARGLPATDRPRSGPAGTDPASCGPAGSAGSGGTPVAGAAPVGSASGAPSQVAPTSAGGASGGHDSTAGTAARPVASGSACAGTVPTAGGAS